MALVKKKTGTAKAGDAKEPEQEQRRTSMRGPGGLLEQLSDKDPQVRRWAVRDLSAFPEAVKPLCEHLRRETVEVVREVIFTSLASIGGDETIKCLIPLLRSEDVALRNGAIEVLQELPEAVAMYMDELIDDSDHDVRGFAIDIMMGLGHRQTPEWLSQMIQEDEDINVCSKAVECLTEIGEPSHIPTLQAMLDRFPDEPYIKFAVDLAIKRIGGSG